MSSGSTVQVHATPLDVAKAAAEIVLEASRRARRRGGPLRLGLSGGTSPLPLYRLLGESRELKADDLEVFFVDERQAPPTEPESNYWMARKTVLEPLGVPPSRVHRMRAERDDLEAAAREYETLVVEPLQLLVLGVGEDGHVASLFPGSPLVEERTRRVAAVFDSPKPPSRRLTMTPRALEEAEKAIVLVTGSAKAGAARAALEGDVGPREVPAALLKGRTWLLDREAAADLSSASG